MEERQLTCIGCPMGCQLQVLMDGKEVQSVTGNTCKRGEIYARKEVTDPTRIVTTTVRVLGGAVPVVSCKTGADIPKDRIFDCCHQLRDLEVKAPVRMGDILLKDICGTGVNLVATSEAAARS